MKQDLYKLVHSHIMLKNGVSLDEWCPPLSESGQNSRNNTVHTIKRKRKTSSLKKFRKQAGESVCIENNCQETDGKLILKNKNGKENGDSVSAERKTSKTVSFSTDSKKGCKSKKGKLFYCPNCQYSTSCKQNVKSHTLHYCSNRNKSVSVRRNNFKHSEILPAKDRYYLCDMCNFSTRYKSNLKAHKLTHLKDKKYTCPFCGFGSNVLNRIHNHIYRNHRESDKKELKVEKLNFGSKDNKKNRSVCRNFFPNCDNLKSVMDRNEDDTKKNIVSDCMTNKCSPTKNVSSLNLMNSNMNCSVVLRKCPDIQIGKGKIYLNSNKDFSSAIDFKIREIKEENETDLEDEEDSSKTEITTENQDQGRNDKYLDTKESQSSLDLAIKEENQSDIECDDSLSSKTTIENQYQDLKNEFLDDKDDHVIRMEATTNESFNQNVKDESKSPNSFCSTSISTIENHQNIKVKSENFSDNDDDDDGEIKGSHNRHKQSRVNRSAKNKSVNNYKVIKITENNTSPVVFKSLECPYTTIFKSKIIQHCETHKKNKNYNCLDCSFTAKCLFVLKCHKKTHLENHFECTICSFSTTSATTLKSHRLLKHKIQSTSSYTASKLRKRSTLCGTTYNCNMCIFKTRDVNSYEEHLKIHIKSMTKREERMARRPLSTIGIPRISKDQKKRKCKQDKRACETKAIKPIKIVKKKYKCEKCSFVTDDMENMSKHKQTHIKSLENDKDFVKNSTESKLEEPESLLSQTTLSCNSCSFTTSLKIVLLKHKQSHTSSPPGVFKCTECRFSTTKNKLLISHLMNHAYKYLYRCIHCNFSSNNKVTLKSHKDSHKRTREKTNIRSFRKNKITVSLQAKNNQSFRCFKCDYSCSSEHLLNQHSLIHLESKLLKCAHCDYETNFKGNLVRHVLIHVDEYIEDP
ncbi:Zinc finger protein [Armadillidium nasatum]|uniref:Zinc finger protein n=1 Tax=Armadillidium nasatum TaxID=96803 RepID=A0A5N5T560_9CRUS|nr:Zinc finger protein [Armadillidium nasatum]